MKPFNIEDYLKNPLIKVVTRDGKSVKIHCTNYHQPRPVVAEVEGCDYSTSFSGDGKYYGNRDSKYDLFFAPEKHEGWMNLYKCGKNYYPGKLVYPTKEEAVHSAVLNEEYVETVKIEWED